MKTVKIWKDTSRTASECWLVECNDGKLAPMEAFGESPTCMSIIYNNVQDDKYYTGDYQDEKGELLYVIDAEGRILVDTGPLVAVFAHLKGGDKVLVVQSDGTFAPLFMQTIELFTMAVYKCSTKCLYTLCTDKEVQDTLGGLVGYIDNKGVYNEV